MDQMNSKPATIKDIANHLGIAFSTVSRALQGKPHVSKQLRARVEAAAAELGYVPNSGARLLHKPRGSSVGLIIPNFPNELFATAAQVFSTRLEQEGFSVMLGVSGDDPQTELRQVMAFCEARVAGIAIATCGRILDRTIGLLRTVPMVDLANRSPDLHFPAVMLDDEHSLNLATTHLLQLGHRRIAYIGGEGTLGTGKRRIDGFRAALAAYNIDPEPSLLQQGPITVDFARMATLRLMNARDRPTGLIVANSNQAEGAVEAISSLGMRLPEDLSLVGHGDASWFKLFGKGITTVDTRTVDLANAGVDILMEQIKAVSQERTYDEEPMRYTLQCNLIQRGSTGFPPSG
jgi:LacI family transcriptional regulator